MKPELLARHGSDCVVDKKRQRRRSGQSADCDQSHIPSDHYSCSKIPSSFLIINVQAKKSQNFFSSHFVYTKAQGSLGVSPDAWLLAAIAIPLTAITIALWGLWISFTGMNASRRLRDTRLRVTSRISPLRGFLSAKSPAQPMDIEFGTMSPQSTLCSPRAPMRSFSGSLDWRSGRTETAVKL